MSPRDTGENQEDAAELQADIIDMLRKQGYGVVDGQIVFPESMNKDDLRRMNQLARTYKVTKTEPALRRREDTLIQYIANGTEIAPESVRPKLVHVVSGSEDELLFRYASLSWSIPVSSGYGRRLRFLVIDEANGKLIGLFGLGDPVYAIRNRDQFIGWDTEAKKDRLYHLMDAYVVGAVPPYSSLLCGKLIALLALSNEVREVFTQKYADRKTVISSKRKNPWLGMITTTSALGRSSVYNRIRLDGYTYWQSVGFTQGSGEFHFTNGIYERIRRFSESNCLPTAKNDSWGKGFRSRREVIKKCLPALGLSSKLLYHGIQREIFVASLAANAREFLRREDDTLVSYDWSVDQLSQKFLERWLLPRAIRMPQYREYKRESFRIWPST